MGTERRGRGMYLQNAANGHPGLPACGRGSSSPTTSAHRGRARLPGSRDMLPLVLLFGLCLTTTAPRHHLPRVSLLPARLFRRRLPRVALPLTACRAVVV